RVRTYIKIGKQNSNDLLSYFFIMGRNKRNKMEGVSGIKLRKSMRKSEMRITPERRTLRTA
ncbi:hypothetical protein, partial [Bacillus pseudomycoides]|uniref:hypothetical protein n=1 Tax=Bacillus pseudomycoides TaxID=64104 RepID=UPI002852A1BC